MKWKIIFIVVIALPFIFGCTEKGKDPNSAVAILPVPKLINLTSGDLCFDDSIFFLSTNTITDSLIPVLTQELMGLAGVNVLSTTQQEKANWIISIDSSLKDQAYKIEIDKQVRITGSDYNALAMGSVTALQMIKTTDGNVCFRKGSVIDQSDRPYRGLLIDLARRKHDIETIKNTVLLCRWYKINYLQLHLTDDQLFTFPSSAFPELPSEQAHFTKEELLGLVEFAFVRGVELVPEFEAPGHSGRMIQKLPGIFGFATKALNRSTINMANEKVYIALDTLIGEVARIFHRSDYIHIGGDEADFSGMEDDPLVSAYLKKHNLKSVEELYWQFINRMNGFVKKRNKKAIVWEGFSKTANKIIDKDITVMAWETIYQMPQDLLDGGFNIINVSWKPLYVVNDKKWTPVQIYNWNIYSWGNWVPKMPSYTPFMISPHPNVVGGSMASWDQPAYTEISSLRQRIPAMAEKIWNLKSSMEDSAFLALLDKTDAAFSRYLSPVSLTADGLSHSVIRDGYYDEQTWFDDKVIIGLTNNRDLIMRYTLDGSHVSNSSPLYGGPIEISQTTTLRYKAFNNGNPVGAEMMAYYDLRPLQVKMSGSFTIPLDSLWETMRSWLIGFKDSVRIDISAKRKGVIRYQLDDRDLNKQSALYTGPVIIKDTSVIKSGLFINDSLIGKPWIQYFQKEEIERD
jgi:hexosaminidase